MTFRHLKIFVTVADTGSMSAAARALYVSQPSVSQAIAELETHYNIRLFERLAQRLYITRAGEALLPYARHITDSFEEMEQLLHIQSQHTSISLGCSVSVGTALLNRILDQIESANSNCHITATIDNTSTIEELVLNNTLDLGIVEGIVRSNELIQQPVYSDELILVCGRHHPLASRSSLSLNELNGENFISREQGSIERNQLENILSQHNITLNRCWTSTNTEAIKNAVIHGRGIAILSNMLVQKECLAGDIVPLVIDDMHIRRTIHLIYHRNKYISPAMQTVIDVLSHLNN